MKKIVSFFMAFLVMVSAFAQQRAVRGKVTDPNGKPLQGVNVSVKGTLHPTGPH
jgi:TonB-dependent starch-binding outer membrane protein SusC